jgi:hypothetical protein
MGLPHLQPATLASSAQAASSTSERMKRRMNALGSRRRE